MDLIASEQFSVIYHGDSVEKGQMDVKELAPSLLALNDLIEEANRTLNGSRTKVSLRVKANIQTNSVEIALEVYQWVLGQTQNIINGLGLLTIRDVLEIIGCAWGTYKYGISLVSLLKKLKGKEVIEAKKEDGDQYILVAVDEKGERAEIKVALEIYLLFSNRLIRTALNKMLAPLKRDGMERIEWKYRGKITEQVAKSDLPAFKPPEADPEKSPDDVVIGRFTIRSVAFDKGMKWRLIHDQTARKFSVTISDDSFWASIEDKRESFHKGDVLEARIEAISHETKAGPRTEWHVTDIYKHYASPEQTPLDLWEPR